MAQPTTQPHTYTQGHSSHTLTTHLSRTAETDAAFLLPYIKPTDHILDIGCGPGTITTSLAKYANQGTTVGLDISPSVLEKAASLAAAANIPTAGPGSVTFKQGNVLEPLPYPDNTFDVIYASQLFGHLPPPDLPVKALKELRRILKQGGILATRDGTDQHFYPRSLDLGRLWVHNQARALGQGTAEPDPTGTRMPALFRAAGFTADPNSTASKLRVGAGTTVYSGPEARQWLAARATGQLGTPGDPFRESWVRAGIAEAEIEETLRAVGEWAAREDAWFVGVQCEMLAWK